MIKKIRLKKHFNAAHKFNIAREKLFKLADKSDNDQKKYIYAIINNLESIRCLLDDYYHELITEEEFNKYGHVYYNPNGKPVPQPGWLGLTNEQAKTRDEAYQKMVGVK